MREKARAREEAERNWQAERGAAHCIGEVGEQGLRETEGSLAACAALIDGERKPIVIATETSLKIVSMKMTPRRILCSVEDLQLLLPLRLSFLVFSLSLHDVDFFYPE